MTLMTEEMHPSKRIGITVAGQLPILPPAAGPRNSLSRAGKPVRDTIIRYEKELYEYMANMVGSQETIE